MPLVTFCSKLIFYELLALCSQLTSIFGGRLLHLQPQDIATSAKETNADVNSVETGFTDLH
jgi:hypothetical protein